ncbi:TspO and MBR related proteins [Lutibacter oricola]|uniref:TspO and MBR related proteins n=1 Tax=Lutibacter oricola TaxID=762486 RepID=A0A1H3A8L4_9FLAO|nr:TspO/MBR family protein [Lutibacter oricola]SDX26082.1 TspO and MBR related proteins [Lutibacter oricola]
MSTHIQYIILFLILNFGALAIGSYLMNNGPQANWYLNLNRAPWTPPGWFFGVAWSTIMVCFSFYLAHLLVLKPGVTFWIVFLIQFVLNIAWNYIFFNQRHLGFGLLEIILLTAVIGYYLFQFGNGLGVKSWLIVPYFIWLIIATSLNGYVYFKN